MDLELDQNFGIFSVPNIGKGNEILEGPGEDETLAVVSRMLIDGSILLSQ